MKLKLTDEQRRVVEQHNGDPIFMEDPKSHRTYRLVLENTDGPTASPPSLDDIAATYPLQQRVAEVEGWNDPAMDDYNDYKPYFRSV